MKRWRLSQCFFPKHCCLPNETLCRLSRTWTRNITQHAADHSQYIDIGGRRYPSDDWTNIPNSVSSAITRRLHLTKDHPISITRQLIESQFANHACYNDLFPVVSVSQNFDALGFSEDHPGRNRSDTYYVNKNTVLRTHTSAHQADLFKQNSEDGWLVTSDVYRRDAIDKTHYPIFHQMEGARTWNRNGLTVAKVVDMISNDREKMSPHDLGVLDPNPTVHKDRNPLQSAYHALEEAEAMTSHLKCSLENAIKCVCNAASASVRSAGGKDPFAQEEIKVRWVEAFFPFTSPSWELEVYWQGDWLEILGCGIIKQELLNNAGVPDRIGWAFGLGLERIAMLLFSIPDIRLFWSLDPRFLSQFVSRNASAKTTGDVSPQPKISITRFEPFSKHPPCYKDVSFWTGKLASDTENFTSQGFHENDFMEVVRDVAGDLAEEARLVDDFVHPKTGRRSVCYRINYRSLERTLTNAETNVLHERLCKELEERLKVSIR